MKKNVRLLLVTLFGMAWATEPQVDQTSADVSPVHHLIYQEYKKECLRIKKELHMQEEAHKILINHYVDNNCCIPEEYTLFQKIVYPEWIKQCDAKLAEIEASGKKLLAFTIKLRELKNKKKLAGNKELNSFISER